MGVASASRYNQTRVGEYVRFAVENALHKRTWSNALALVAAALIRDDLLTAIPI